LKGLFDPAPTLAFPMVDAPPTKPIGAAGNALATVVSATI
jgi:hypothetical protein